MLICQPKRIHENKLASTHCLRDAVTAAAAVVSIQLLPLLSLSLLLLIFSTVRSSIGDNTYIEKKQQPTEWMMFHVSLYAFRCSVQVNDPRSPGPALMSKVPFCLCFVAL